MSKLIYAAKALTVENKTNVFHSSGAIFSWPRANHMVWMAAFSPLTMDQHNHIITIQCIMQQTVHILKSRSMQFSWIWVMHKLTRTGKFKPFQCIFKMALSNDAKTQSTVLYFCLAHVRPAIYFCSNTYVFVLLPSVFQFTAITVAVNQWIISKTTIKMFDVNTQNQQMRGCKVVK